MKNIKRLKGIGLVKGTPARELKEGDITRWNNGDLEKITSVEFSKTGKTMVVGIEYVRRNGERVLSERKFKSDRLVNIVASGNVELTGYRTYEEVKEADVTEEKEEVEGNNNEEFKGKLVGTMNGWTERLDGYDHVNTLEGHRELLVKLAKNHSADDIELELYNGRHKVLVITKEEAHTEEPRKRTAVRKYYCDCNCGQIIGKGTEYYQLGPKGTNYKIVHHKCIKKVKAIS